MANAEEDRGYFENRETSSAPALPGNSLELELDRYLHGLKYIGVETPHFSSNKQVRILFSDLVTAEFRGRKPDPEFPMSLDSLESLLHRKGFLNTDYVFLPSVETQVAMRQSDQRLFSLGVRGQRRTSPREAHLWGINVMNYLQAPALFSLLQLAGIPLLREERSDSFPLIILGGHIWQNPLPLSSFYDVMVLGDGEQTLAEITKLTARLSSDKAALLAEIARLDGTYVPGITRQATRCVHIDFENPGFASGSTYLLNGVGALVLSRGCPYDCAFCLNGLIGGQYRVKPFSQIVEQVDHMKRGGAQKLMLLAASASSYHSEGKTIEDVIRYVEDQGMTIRTMSDRPESLTRAYLQQSMKEKHKVIFAPETCPRIRYQVLHKTLTEETLWRGISLAIEAGISHIQLYIILCIPPISPRLVDFLPDGFAGEQDEDLRYVADLAISIVDRM
ncbi:MAG: radical SAM protein, partial [Chloroflexota bacterium]